MQLPSQHSMLGHHRHASETLIVVLGSSLPSSTKKNILSKLDPSDKTFLIRTCSQFTISGHYRPISERHLRSTPLLYAISISGHRTLIKLCGCHADLVFRLAHRLLYWEFSFPDLNANLWYFNLAMHGSRKFCQF